MQLDLNADECRDLVDTLDNVLSDLSYEIADTDSYDYRTGLKSRRDRLKAVRDRLAAELEA